MQKLELWGYDQEHDVIIAFDQAKEMYYIHGDMVREQLAECRAQHGESISQADADLDNSASILYTTFTYYPDDLGVCPANDFMLMLHG